MEAITIVLILLNIYVTYRGLQSTEFFSRYSFEVEKVLLYKDYKRIITSGFLHVSWMHLFFNMLSLYFFSGSLEAYLGIPRFLIIYFASLAGGNVFSLLLHKNDGGYSSVGASGAVCGIVFASIALFPGMEIGLFPLPISFPAWIYGVAFVIYSIYGVRSRRDNIGHESHLAGALTGMFVALLLRPEAFLQNYFVILLLAVPAIAFIAIIINKPELLMVDNLFQRKNKDFYSVDHKYNADKQDLQKRVDRILEKIHQKGIKSLSDKEKKLLEDYSRSGGAN